MAPRHPHPYEHADEPRGGLSLWWVLAACLVLMLLRFLIAGGL